MDEIHRDSKRTAAEGAAPARNRSGLGARRDGEMEGNGGGRHGLLIEAQKEGDRRINCPNGTRDRRSYFLPMSTRGDDGRKKKVAS